MSSDRNRHAQSSCPSRHELSEFATGGLALMAAEAVADHVAACSRCLAILAELDCQPNPLLTKLRDSVRLAPLSAGDCDRIVAIVNAIGEQASAKNISPIDNDRAPNGTVAGSEEADGGTNVTVRCPHCHDLLERSHHDLSEEMECGVCHGRFSLAVDESDRIGVERGVETVAHFKIVDRLGEGSFGTVWKARDTLLDRIVALKIPRAGRLEETRIDLFLREAKAAAQVHHPNIVGVFEVGRDGELTYIASDYVEGKSLDRLLDGQPLAPREACTMCLAIADALQAAHVAGIVHRDLKPANIIVDAESKPYITDFGLAKHRTDEATVTVEGRILGTPTYMPPEQARGKGGEADQRSDVYSIGVIFFELLTGQPPFRGDVRMLVSQILFDQPPQPRKLNDRIPRDLETICLKCLHKQPTRRYQSAGDLRDDLRRFLDGQPIQARRVSYLGRLWRWCGRKPAVATLSATLAMTIVAAVLGLTLAYLRTSSSLSTAKRHLYFHQIAAAQQKWRANDPRAARAALDACPPELRGFEWGYLSRLFGVKTLTLPNAGRSVAYTRDGAHIVTTGGSELAVKMWDAESGKCLFRLYGDTRHLVDLDIGPQGRMVVTAGGADQSVRLWDLVERRALGVVGYHRPNVQKSRFSPDGTRIISCGADRHVRVWETSTGEELAALDLRPRRIRALAVSPVETRVAIAFGRGETSGLTLWDYETTDQRQSIPCEGKTISGLAFSNDGRRLATAESHGAVRTWQLEPLRELEVIIGPVNDEPGLVFDPEGGRLAAELQNGAIRVWEATTGRELVTLRGLVSPIRHIDFHPEGRYLAAGCAENAVCVWDSTIEQGCVALRGPVARVTNLDYSPDGELLAAVFDDGSVHVWNPSRQEIVLSLSEVNTKIHAAAFSPDGNQLVTAAVDGTVTIRDVSRGEIQVQFGEHTRIVRTVAFTPDGRRVASAGGDRKVLLWDARTGETEMSFPAGQPLTSVAIDRRGTKLAAGGAYTRVVVWDIRSGEELWRQDDLAGRIWNLAWSPDGKILGIARGDGSIQLRDSIDGSTRGSFGYPAHHRRCDLAFSPDGHRLATATGRTAVSLWEIPSGHAVLSLSRRSTITPTVAFHPDGHTLATADIDGTIKLWKAAPFQGAPAGAE